MPYSGALLYTAFEDTTFLAKGRLDEVALKVRRRGKSNPSARILIFSDVTGKEIDLDLSGSEAQVLSRLKIFVTQPKEVTSIGPGRPKLGVIPREVSLLPRHWEWLATQSGGASATLRRLVEEACKNPAEQDLQRQAQERTHRFMTAIAGDLPHYEEALRALYSGDKKNFDARIQAWPEDIREHARRLASAAWTNYSTARST